MCCFFSNYLRFKDLQDEIANIQNQQPELERIMATSEEKTEETAEKLDTVQNAIHGANEVSIFLLFFWANRIIFL